MNKVEKIITVITLILFVIVVGALIFFTATKTGRQYMSNDQHTDKITSEYTLKEDTIADIKITKQND